MRRENMTYKKKCKLYGNYNLRNAIHTIASYGEICKYLNLKDIYNINNQNNLLKNLPIQAEYMKGHCYQTYDEAVDLIAEHILIFQQQNINNLKHIDLLVYLSQNKIKIRARNDKYVSIKKIFQEFYLKGFYLNFIPSGRNSSSVEKMIKDRYIMKRIISNQVNKERYYTYELLLLLRDYLKIFSIFTCKIEDFDDLEDQYLKEFSSMCYTCKKTDFPQGVFLDDIKDTSYIKCFQSWYRNHQEQILNINFKSGKCDIPKIISEFDSYFKDSFSCTCGKKLPLNHDFLYRYLRDSFKY